MDVVNAIADLTTPIAELYFSCLHNSLVGSKATTEMDEK